MDRWMDGYYKVLGIIYKLSFQFNLLRTQLENRKNFWLSDFFGSLPRPCSIFYAATHRITTSSMSKSAVSLLVCMCTKINLTFFKPLNWSEVWDDIQGAFQSHTSTYVKFIICGWLVTLKLLVPHYLCLLLQLLMLMYEYAY